MAAVEMSRQLQMNHRHKYDLLDMMCAAADTLIWAHFNECWQNPKSIWWFFAHLCGSKMLNRIQSRECISTNQYWFARVPATAAPPPIVIFSLKYHIKFSCLHFKQPHCYGAAAAVAATVECYSRRNACLNDALALVIMWKQLQKNHQMFFAQAQRYHKRCIYCNSKWLFPHTPFAPLLCTHNVSLYARVHNPISSYSNMSRSIYEPWIHITILLSRSTI